VPRTTEARQRLRRATADDAVAVAAVYLRSFKTALPSVRLAHDDDDVRAHVAAVVVAQRETWVAVQDGRVVAFMTLHEGVIEHLYVAPEDAGRGHCTALLDLAKRRSPAGLRLFTFQVNTCARRFYEQRGFTALAFSDGTDNEEREPDVLYGWPAGS
jgi:ribosomal protein S18 acetylase RimI-like enzyme